MPRPKIERRTSENRISQRSDDFLDQTAEFWQQHSPDRQLTREDARQINENMTGFFQLLLEWERKERALQKPPHGKG